MSTVRDYVDSRLADWRLEGQVPRADWQRFADLVPLAADRLAVVDSMITELLGTRDIGLAGTYAINEICARLLRLTNADDLLPAVGSGQLRLALALTEPGAGSDLARLQTAVSPGPPAMLSGHKTFIANGTIADLFIVASRSGDGGSLPLIDLHVLRRDQVEIADLHGVGAQLMRLADLRIDEVPVAETRRLGRPGRGFRYVNRVLTFERAIVGCLAVRFARVLLEDLGTYLSEREVFGAPLIEHGFHRLRLGDWWAEQRVLARALDRVVADIDAGTDLWQDVFALKVRASAFVIQLAMGLQHVGGASDWIDGGRWARVVDDVRWLTLAGGVVEVLQDRLARDALAPNGPPG